MSKPLIAITGSRPDERFQLYVDGVERAGGDPLPVFPDGDVAIEDALRRAGALVLTGGEDINPARYGETPAPAIPYMPFNDARDELELSMTGAALDDDMPIYGICRGMQLLNVAMGGKLAQHVSDHIGEGNPDDGYAPEYHHIYISPGSKLAAVVGSGGTVRVNSYHHQAVREAQKSPRLLASAYSLEDGLIEALESPDHRWVIAVQFHPERRMELPPHFDRLFQSLVERAAERVGGRSRL